MLQVFDGREALAVPDDTSLANLAEDTENSVRWFRGLNASSKPDLGIIAQLESSSPDIAPTDIASPVGVGALVRHRIRRQLPGAEGAFLNESRTGVCGPSSGDGLADRLMNCVVRLENLGTNYLGYTFAPSVYEIESMLMEKGAEFVAVSSSEIDPACFLGGWLRDAYLWDYHLPSYSQRAGDTNGYYLISQLKDLDRETLKTVLRRLPESDDLDDETVTALLLEVARRGIPTVRGLSGGGTGATGDLGLFIAARLLQDEFRPDQVDPGLLPVMSEVGNSQVLSLVIPVDPFEGYMNDMQKALGLHSKVRPDLLVAGIEITGSIVKCHLTPVEVKYRNGKTMSPDERKSALEQATALSSLLREFQIRAETSDLLLWKIAFQHFVISMLGYGFRVYSQQRIAIERSQLWSNNYQKVVSAILSGEIEFTIDKIGRLIVVDATPNSGPHDSDGDGFQETVVISQTDASRVLLNDPVHFYTSIRDKLGDWKLNPAPILAKKHPKQPKGIQPNLPNLAGMKLLVGTTVDAFDNKHQYLNLSDTKLNQLNIGVVGDLGTGKTQFLKSLVYQISRSKNENSGIQPKFLIFDYKKDYSSEDFVEAAGARIQSPSNLPLNLFDISGASEGKNAWLSRFKFFSDVLDKIYSGVGPVQRLKLKTAVKAAYQAGEQVGKQPTIYDVHEQYELLLKGKPDSVFGILDDLVDMELFARDPGEGSGFADFLDGVVVIQLNELGQDDRTKNMLVAIMLNLFYENMLTIPKRSYVGTDPQLRIIDAFLLVDEADNILHFEFDVLRKILLQGREFGVGVILASQYLRHFKVGATDYREPLLTWFIHKVPNIVPQELDALGLTGANAHLTDRIKQLPNHHCLFKTVDVAGEVIDGTPFYKISH
jgi:DNA phosphorothioation-dependent restriction protein DptH